MSELSSPSAERIVTSSVFPHPLAEEVYATILDDELPEHEKAHLAVTEEQYGELKQKHSDLIRMSVEEVRAVHGDRIVNEVEGTTWNDLSDDKLRSLQGFYYGYKLQEGAKTKTREAKIRNTVNFVLSGLTVIEGNPLVVSMRNYLADRPYRGAETIPFVVYALNSGEKERRFATDAAFRLGKLLTPEVVEAVTGMQERPTPVLKQVPQDGAVVYESYLVAPEGSNG